ncbi:imidazoleglycerol-phosphate dehydratase HisB [Christensenella intestinihominis]|uniref:imidazoleglycerol-phosphate dehydratase HisB n=1 Tax=Christensenella intestinihominis TaxID=1851429 RepID=UPI000835A5AA|nr:imidazoleglycerol-phosphate dehydratase HisB [Christensenella intestinihominis]
MARKGAVARTTNETDIRLAIELDGSGIYKIDTGVGFLDHMLDLFTRHAMVDLELSCKGDTYVDAHHTVEDCGIALGGAIKTALGDKAGIRRYATKFVPMDETLMMVNLDISSRPYFVYHMELRQNKVGDFDAELCEEFFRAVAVNAGLTLHLNLQYGKNTHHIIEAAFKAFGQALREAVSVDPQIKGVFSTKGVL